MKIIAFYLPQFHEVKENNQWWGNGFTEWVNVRKAKPLFKNHYQPRIPLKGYYDLTDAKTLLWQAKTAKEYGLYGFCFYHYWFNGKKLLHHPTELFLDNKDIDIHFCLCWANETWTKAWAGKTDEVLIKQTYGNKTEWEEHFDYLYPFFKDDRYIKINGKPLFLIYRANHIDNMVEMINYYQVLAKRNGFPGIAFAAQDGNIVFDSGKKASLYEYIVEYQPAYCLAQSNKKRISLSGMINGVINRINPRFNVFQKPAIRNYDMLWKNILRTDPKSSKSIPGAFVDWDNTPRRGNRGWLCDGANPEKFRIYLSEQIRNTKDKYAKDLLFIFAWNEWAEGGYLEPDEKYGYQYLQAIKDALIENNEL